MFKKTKSNTQQEVPYKRIGRPAWQYQITLLKSDEKCLYGIEKKVGDTFRVILPNCSHTVPAIGNFIEYNVTDIWLDDGLALINSSGRILFRSLKSVAYINDKLIAINLNDSSKYRLYHTQIGRLTRKEYTDFEVYEDYIQTFDGELTGILNWDFEEELSANYVEVIPFGNVYKGTTSTGKEVIGSSKWAKTSTQADKIFPEANGFFRAYSGTRYGFIRGDTGHNLTQFVYENARDFEKNGIACVKTALSWTYLDSNGKVLPPPGEAVVL